MSVPDSAPQNESKHLTINVNLPAALAQLDRNLQRLVDLVSVGVRGVHKVEEADYAVSPFASSQQLAERLPYSEMQEEYLHWALRAAFTEAIDRVSEFLEECRVLVTFYRLGTATIRGDAWNRIWTTERDAFDRKGFPQKIEWLRQQCAATFQFEEHVLTLNRARNASCIGLGTYRKRMRAIAEFSLSSGTHSAS